MINPGQEVAVQSGYGNNLIDFGYTVVKATPGGQVVVKRTSDAYEMRFDANGTQMGKHVSSRYPSRLIIDLDSAHETVRITKAKAEAVAAINAVRGDAGRYNDKESLHRQVMELATALEVARLAVQAI